MTNSTDNDIQIKIYKLSDPYLGLTSYDTIILKDKSVKFYSYGQIGEYRNPSDTITIFDSLVVTKNNIKSLKYFKQLNEWNYSIKESYHLYQLDIKSSDF